VGTEQLPSAAPYRAWTRGRVTAYMHRHALAWELITAGLTVVYVVLAFLQDQSPGSAVSIGVGVLALVFVIEFSVRLYDAPSRTGYLRRHWLDIVTCIPAVGPFRAIRLVRLVGFIRLGAAARAYGVGAAASERLPGGSGTWVLGPILLIVWVASSYAYYELEGGVNPHVGTFADALYYPFVTATTLGYGSIAPVTPEGKILTGILIFISIGLLGFASAQLTARLLPQTDAVSDLKKVVDRQNQLLQEMNARLDAVSGMLQSRAGSQSGPVGEDAPSLAH
jgi:voltage-gated potassium channel